MKHKARHGLGGVVLKRTHICLGLLLLAIPVTAQQSGVNLTFDPGSTTIHWTLGAVMHTVHGTFRLKSGSVHVDPATGEMTGLIVIDASSGESGDTARDQKMHQNILESAQYPTITFRPTHLNGSFQPSRNQTVTIDGVFTLHGHPHLLQLTVNAAPGANGISVTTNFDVPYVEWGLKDPSTFVLRVSKSVSINIDATAKVKP